MTVFASSVLDDFNRASATPPSANWSILYGATADISITGSYPNQATQWGNASTPSWYGDYWNAATYGDCESFCTIDWPSQSNYVVLLSRLQSPGTSSILGYAAALTRDGSNATSRAYCGVWDATHTSFGSSLLRTQTATVLDYSLSSASGDRFGARTYDWGGTVIVEGWVNYAADALGWRPVQRWADYDHANAITSSGYLGVVIAANISGQKTRIDDYSGGAITPAAVNLDDFPGHQGGRRDRLAEKVFASTRGRLAGERRATGGIRGGGIALLR